MAASKVRPVRCGLDNGNRAIAAIGTATSYSYNSENMLVAGGAITLAYDPLMRLYQASTARWAYDGAPLRLIFLCIRDKLLAQ